MVDIADYAALQARIAQYIDDDTQTARIPGFIEMAERKWDRTLWIPARENVASSSGATERLGIPDDCQVLRSVSVAGIGQLRQTTPNEAFTEVKRAHPYAYSIQRDEIVFEPALQGVEKVTVLYYMDLPFLSSTVTTNWLLEKHPDLYLYGALIQTYAYLVDDEQATLWKGAHDETLADIMGLAAKQRYGGGPLIARNIANVT